MKKRKQILSLTLSLLMFTPMINNSYVYAASNNDTENYNSVSEYDEINIPDKNLKALILDSLQKDSNYKLTRYDLESITNLYSNNYSTDIEDDKKISSLEGLQYCTNLTNLALGINNISDLTPLANLTKLDSLQLYLNNISDISPLKNLTNLTTLVLADNHISDISTLKNLSNLTNLYMDTNQISDLSSLSGLTSLSTLCLGNNNISDLSPLAGLKNISYAYLGDQSISLDDAECNGVFSFINPITNVDKTPITAISEVQNGYYRSDNNMIYQFTDKDISLSYKFNQNITLGSASAQFSGTVKRNITFKDVDIPDKNLKTLILNTLNKDPDYKLTNYDLESITSLDSNNYDTNMPDDKKISSLEGLQYCPNLTNLALGINNISDLTPLANLTKLNSLRLYSNDISDISPLKNLTNLTTLVLADNNISDISALKNLTNLTDLFIGDNQISDLSPLASFTKLTTLHLSQNNISDLSPLANLKNISYMYLENQSITLENLDCKPGKFSFTNPITNVNKTPITSIFTVEHGYYNPSDNKIYSSADESTDISYSFSQNISLNSANVEFSGTVTKKINIENKVVNIPDVNLRKTILETLGEDSDYTITEKDMDSITSLYHDNPYMTDDEKISSLEGLQYCTNVTDICLGMNNISDLSPLANLTKLSTLRVSGNDISDISPLKDLTTLTTLVLSDNHISDISTLKNLTNLTDLFMGNNQISDLSPISELTNLTSLYLANNNIYNLSPLANLKNISFMYLVNQSISLEDLNSNIGDFSFVNPVTNIDNTPITSINDVQTGSYNSNDNKIYSTAYKSSSLSYTFNQNVTLGSTNAEFSGTVDRNINIEIKAVNIPDKNLRNLILEKLDKDSDYTITDADLASIDSLDNNLIGAQEDEKISSLEGLEYCINLTSISFYYNNISDLSPLKNLKNLTSLDLRENKISNLESLSSITSLNNLSLVDNSINDITPLKNLTNLTSLNLWSTNTSDISPLSALTHLKTLNLRDNFGITDLTPLSNLTKLKDLNVMQCRISNIIPLKSLTNLTSLSLGFNYISDISSLSNLTDLKELELQNNKISDVSPLSNLCNLNKLFLNKNNIYDISPLETLSNISDLYADSQSVLLNTEELNPNNSISFVNPVINLDKTPVTSITDVVNGEYKVDDNTIYSNNFDKSSVLSYNFKQEFTLGSATAAFSGTVKKNINVRDNSVNIPDAALKTLVLNELSKPADYLITADDMASITSLDSSFYFGSEKISSLDGMEYCTNLTNLKLCDNNISDLSPLSNLMNLKSLNLDDNKISNLSPLSKLTNLDKLSLNINNITDISPLKNLTSLTSLTLYGNKISSLNALSTLINLNELSLGSSNFTDFTPLKSLTNLKTLELWSTNFTDLSLLTNLSNLETLEITNSFRLTNISPLSNLTKLKKLNLMGDNVSDISALKALTNLTSLSLGFNFISNISPLSDLTNLKELYLQKNKVSNLSALSNLTNLNELMLSDNQIYDISPLRNLSNISSLYLDNQSISLKSEDCKSNDSISFVNPLINLDNTPVTSITDVINGSYKIEDNKLYSNKLNKSSELKYNFSQELTLGSAKTTFSGTIVKKVNVK